MRRAKRAASGFRRWPCHSEDLRITERYRRPDFGHLVIEFTFTDPKYYERPWTATISFDLMPDN